jgi:hypothetical protein
VILERLGIDPAKLPKTKLEKQRTLILDADGAAYRAAATAKTLPTALRRFCTEVLEWQFLTNCNNVRLHLTGQGGYKAGRALYPAFKPYQGNRTGKAKPALLEPLRELLGTPQAYSMGMPEDWYCKLHRYWEADDACTMDSYVYRDDGLVVSDDKDLRMTVHPYWEARKGAASVLSDDWGYISTDTEATYPVGHGLCYFWLQLLMGDTADNIRGLDKLHGKNVGKAGAVQFLEGRRDADAVANEVLWHFAAIEQDPLAEAELLWMRRHEQDSAYSYLSSLDLDPRLKVWLGELHHYHQQILSRGNCNEYIP